MKIYPINDEIFIEMEDAKLGALNTDSVKTGQEWGVIKAIGTEVKNKDLKVGVKIFVKGWSMDTILHDGITYVFTTESRKGIKAIIK